MRSLYKLGGSLLDYKLLDKALAQFLTAEAKQTALDELSFEPLIVVGGGTTADLVRSWDQLHTLGEETAHWLALQALDFNAELLASIFVNTNLVTNQQEILEAWEHCLIPLLKPYMFVKLCEPSSKIPLPHRWDVTTDSVALWFCEQLIVDQYVFLKSRDCPDEFIEHSTQNIKTQQLEEMSKQELIDPYFPKLFSQLRTPPIIKWVNLRA